MQNRGRLTAFAFGALLTVAGFFLFGPSSTTTVVKELPPTTAHAEQQTPQPNDLVSPYGVQPTQGVGNPYGIKQYSHPTDPSTVDLCNVAHVAYMTNYRPVVLHPEDTSQVVHSTSCSLFDSGYNYAVWVTLQPYATVGEYLYNKKHYDVKHPSGVAGGPEVDLNNFAPGVTAAYETRGAAGKGSLFDDVTALVESPSGATYILTVDTKTLRFGIPGLDVTELAAAFATALP